MVSKIIRFTFFFFINTSFQITCGRSVQYLNLKNYNFLKPVTVLPSLALGPFGPTQPQLEIYLYQQKPDFLLFQPE
jgi:hypothetical protein